MHVSDPVPICALVFARLDSRRHANVGGMLSFKSRLIRCLCIIEMGSNYSAGTPVDAHAHQHRRVDDDEDPEP